MADAEPRKVSVIIPAYNCAKTLGKTLQAVQGQDFPVELIVVDDGSTDATPQIIQSISQAQYIRQENAGPATARNTGAAAATGEFLLFTDGDCVPHTDWVKTVMSPFSDPQVAVVAGSYGIANPQSLLARCVYQEIMFRHWRLPASPRVFGSYNFGIRKAVFDEVGGFHPEFRHASGEDNDLSYRILDGGYKIYFAKDALVDHHHPTRLRKYLFEQYRHGFWRVKMYRRHPRMSRGDDYTFWKDIVEIPLLLVCLGGGVLIFLNIPGSQLLVEIILILVILIQLIFGLIITKNFLTGLYFAAVMFLRAISRTLGFSRGFLDLPRRPSPP